MIRSLIYSLAGILLILSAHVAYAQDLKIGDQVLLSGGTSRGIPLHKEAKSSRFGFAEPDTQAEILGFDQTGRWLLLETGAARAWVLKTYIQSAPIADKVLAESQRMSYRERVSEIDRTTLLDAACDGAKQTMLENQLFKICHDSDLRIPIWVAYPMAGNELGGPGDREHSSWRLDNRLGSDSQANNRIYSGSGYHKGHLAPAQDYVRTQQAVDGTHIFTNAVPQFSSINSGAWSKLETGVRSMAMSGAQLWVITGSLFVPLDPDCQRNRPAKSCLIVDTSLAPTRKFRWMRNEIAVPSHTFKAVLAEKEGQWTARAFIMPNIPRGAGKFANYVFSVDELESMLGIDLFSTLPDDLEAAIESRPTPLS